MNVSPTSPVLLDPLFTKPAPGPAQPPHAAERESKTGTEAPRRLDEPIPPLRPTLQDRIDVCRRLLDLRQV